MRKGGKDEGGQTGKEVKMEGKARHVEEWGGEDSEAKR